MNGPAIALTLACCLMSGWTGRAAAEAPGAAAGGLRVSYQSYYTAEIEAVIEAAGKAGKIPGYSHAKAADNGFTKWLKGGENALKPPQKAAVENGETDALIFGMWWSSVGRWYGVTGEKSSMNLVAGWGVKNTPSFRLLWQTHWATLMGDEAKKQDFLAPEVLKPIYERARKQLEEQAEFVNKQHEERVVVIIPVADAVLKLRAMVADGAFPGLSEQSELFIPGTWNAHRHIRMLTAYCNFAALFGVSPEGLSPSVDHLNYKPKGGAPNSMAGIAAEQHTILQKLAWETVSQYRYSGISSDTNPHVVRATDSKLEKEFDYLVYDLGEGVELKLVKVPAKGQKFAVGSSAKERDEVTTKYFDGNRPAGLDFEVEEKVTLTDDFYIGQHEVTRGQFRRFVEDADYTTETEASDGGYGWDEQLKKFEGRDRKYSWKNYGVSSETDDFPVTNITRNDARKFCEWLAKKGDGKIRLREVRLPGEAEWEFACRAGSRSRFSFGDEDGRLTEFANVADGSWAETFSKSSPVQGKDGHAFSSPVGQFQPNAFGLYDMHGNAWEWVEDYYGKYSALPKERNAIQTVNQGQQRPVMRGGAWYTGPEACRSAKRWLVGIGGRYGSGGFRVVCMP